MSACARAGGSPAAARAARARAGPSPRCIVAPSRGRRAVPGGRRAVPARRRASSAEDASIQSLAAETSPSSPSSPSSSTRVPGSREVPSSPSFSSATRSLDLDVAAPHADPNARVWYLPNFLDDDAFAAVRDGCEKLRKRMKSDHSFATGRLSAVVPPTSAAYAAFCNARALRKLRDASGVGGPPPGRLPDGGAAVPARVVHGVAPRRRPLRTSPGGAHIHRIERQRREDGVGGERRRL